MLFIIIFIHISFCCAQQYAIRRLSYSFVLSAIKWMVDCENWLGFAGGLDLLGWV